MKNADYMTISEFSKLSGISRANLIFYDKIGLLSPAIRDKKEYRLYSRQQLGNSYMIMILRDIGLSLKEIGHYSNQRTPELMTRLFTAQEAAVRQKMKKLRDSLDVMRVYAEMAQSTRHIREHKIDIIKCAAEPVFFGPLIDYSGGKTYAQATIDFWRYCQTTEVALSYPLGARISQKNLTAGGWLKPDQLYLRTARGTTKKPAGLYAIGYDRGNYGQTDRLYKRMLQSIRRQGYAVAGDAFEEYPLNEVSTQNPQDFLIRVAIRVKPR